MSGGMSARGGRGQTLENHEIARISLPIEPYALQILGKLPLAPPKQREFRNETGCHSRIHGCLAGWAHPVTVITQHGEVFRGTFTGGLGGSGFSMSSGKATCSSEGGGDSVFRCSDGRTGILTWTGCTDKGGCSGGRMRFSDGTEGDFTFGQI